MTPKAPLPVVLIILITARCGGAEIPGVRLFLWDCSFGVAQWGGIRWAICSYECFSSLNTHWLVISVNTYLHQITASQFESRVKGSCTYPYQFTLIRGWCRMGRQPAVSNSLFPACASKISHGGNSSFRIQTLMMLYLFFSFLFSSF